MMERRALVVGSATSLFLLFSSFFVFEASDSNNVIACKYWRQSYKTLVWKKPKNVYSQVNVTPVQIVANTDEL